LGDGWGVGLMVQDLKSPLELLSEYGMEAITDARSGIQVRSLLTSFAGLMTAVRFRPAIL